ncbi:MAG: transglycosylase SLT domain-containing protein [Ruminococcus flavefaciens]|nr:transglycosylase SLT domain-containing protein [Ruminococcus flavefaciens]
MQTKMYRVTALDVARIEKLLIKFLLIGVGIGALIAVIITSVIFKFIYDGKVESYETQISHYTATLANVDQQRETLIRSAETELSNTIDTYENREADYNNQIEKLNMTIDTLNQEIETLHNAQAAEFDRLQEYWYIFEHAPKNSGLTLDHIRYSWEVCETWNVNPQVMWAIYDVESDFNPMADNSQSSARGLGQTLESTAVMIWEGVLGHEKGSYNHSMAYDPYVNIEISTCLLGRNLTNGTLENALNLYGDGTESYPSRVLSAAKDHGYTITESNARYTN